MITDTQVPMLIQMSPAQLQTARLALLPVGTDLTAHFSLLQHTQPLRLERKTFRVTIQTESSTPFLPPTADPTGLPKLEHSQQLRGTPGKAYPSHQMSEHPFSSPAMGWSTGQPRASALYSLWMCRSTVRQLLSQLATDPQWTNTAQPPRDRASAGDLSS